jgi:hypothetical protein
MQNYLNSKPGLYRISTQPYTSNSFIYPSIVIFNGVKIVQPLNVRMVSE